MRSLILATVFVSTSALACPDLSGTYAACRSTTGAGGSSSDVVITQSIQNGVTVYSMTSTDNENNERGTETIVADGVVRNESMSSEGVEFQVTTQNSCSGSALVMAQSMSYQGQEIVNVNLSATKSGNTITMEMTGSALGEAVTDTIVCQ